MPPAQAASGGGAAWRRLLVLLTVLPLTLAAAAFVLQWRGGGVDDPTARWPPHAFPGMAEPTRVSLPSSDCTDVLAGSSVPSFPYLRNWSFPSDKGASPKVCVQTSTSAGLEQILPWLFYHKVVGVAQFLIFVEGKAAKPKVAGVLESIPGVKVVYRTKDLEEQQARSFFYKPCNYELFVKQSLNMEMAIIMARDLGMDWIIHLDTDELLYPGGAAEYSVRHLLAEVPHDVDMVIFPNYESSVERDNIKDPFSEAFIIASTASEEEMLRWYNERVVWNDKQLNLKLLRKGVLTRIYTPMAIVQGLRESGVFTSVIASGQPSVNEKLLRMKTDAQGQNVTKLGNLPTKQIRSSDSTASARKILQAAELAFRDRDVTAVPPLSPPSLDDVHRHHSE
nr:unnamed protein product [Digitaria exilis]